MRFGVLALLAACRFDPLSATDPDATPPAIDADSPPDPEAGQPDAAVLPVCTVGASAAAMAAGTVGGPGGGTDPDLACPAGEVPIGAEFETSVAEDQAFNNQHVVITTHLRCGKVERTTANTFITTPADRVTRDGCEQPVTLSGELLCPAGAVMIGLRGNASGGQFSSLNSVQIVCAALAVDLTTTMMTTLDFRPATGEYTNGPESATCQTGAVVAFASKSGCAQDSLAPKCAPLRCQ